MTASPASSTRSCVRPAAAVWALAATLAVAAGPLAPARGDDRPLNVLFIVADDLGWMDLGVQGSTFYDTPHLDQLAATGTRFTDGYTASPVCSPTRSSMMTGQTPARTRNTDFFGAPSGEAALQRERFQRLPLVPAEYIDRLDAGHVTIAEALKEAGYATFFAGKWHLGPEGSWPEDHGFDINKGGHDRGGPYGGNRYFSPYGNPRLTDGPEGEHLPDRLAAETVKFIEEHRDQPFFATLWFYSVHTPLMGREDLVEKYRQRKEELEIDTPLFGQEPPREVRLVQEHAVYGAMVEAMDQAIGRVLDGLEAAGAADRTLVIFTSDNGGLSTSEGSPTSNVPLRAGKGWLYEGGIRVPLLVRWPGVTEPGSVSAWPVNSTDYYPTILEACGLPARPDQHVDAASFAPALRDADAEPPARPLFWHYPHWGNQGGTPGGVVRDGDWKLIEFYDGRPLELYRLDLDIGESNNLVEAHPEQATRLHGLLRDWLEETDALMPTVNEHPDAGTGRP